jgi:hypothetical protein
MLQRMSTTEFIDFEQRHADDAFYVAIEPLCTLLEAEMSSFGLNAAECYQEVYRLLDMIIEKGENFIRNIDKVLIKLHNEYKRCFRQSVDRDVYGAVCTVAGFTALALQSSCKETYSVTLAQALKEATCRLYDGSRAMLQRIESTPLDEGWFDSYLEQKTSAKARLETGADGMATTGDAIGRLTPIFKGNVREAEAFLRRIDGAKPTAVTEEVNRLLRAGMVTRAGCKGDLWQVLHDYGYYRPSLQNWNYQVNF